MPYRRVSTAYQGDNDQWPRGSFLGNIGRAITHVVGGAISGFKVAGPLGGIAGAAVGTVTGTMANIKAGNVATAPPMTITPPAFTPNQMGVVQGPGGVIMSPGGTPVSSVGLAKLGMAGAGGAARGHHLNKSWTYSRRTGQLAAPGTKVVSNRRMNWANGRALGRAETRIHSAVKHMSRYIRWVHPKKDGHAAPKFGRRKK